MIVIISKKVDYTTSQVIKWLKYYKYACVRINTDSLILLKIDIDFCFEINKQTKNLIYTRKVSQIATNSEYGKLIPFLNGELYHGLIKPIYLSARKRINSIESIEKHNKFELLAAAENFGITTPKTIITNKKQILYDFVEKNNIDRLITKPANEPFSFRDSQFIYRQFTSEITREDIQALTETFTISVFQEKIDKLYEVKVVFVLGKFYPAALLPINGNNATDIRQDKFNVRIVPIKIPYKIQDNLKKLLNKYHYDVCTVDFILSRDLCWVFLEVNPCGQFSDISQICNYHLDKKIAKSIIKFYEK